MVTELDLQEAGVRLVGEGSLVEVVLARQPGNRFSFGLLQALQEVLVRLRGMQELRAVLLRAEGSNFSEGADLEDAQLQARVMGEQKDREEVAELGQAVVEGWASLPVPTVVAAQGWVIGAGACLLTVCDFRVCVAGDTRVRFPEVDRGMYLSWGILPRLVQEFGFGLARCLALAGEAVAVEDFAPGAFWLVSEAEGLEAEARRRAEALAAKPPLATRAIKEVFVALGERHGSYVAEDPRRFAQTVGSEDFMEAMAAWFARRPPQFKGR